MKGYQANMIQKKAEAPILISDKKENSRTKKENIYWCERIVE